MNFTLKAEYQPEGDQPQAIQQLTDSLRAGNRYQTLLGVTGSGKTFTMANVIQNLQRPTLIISHNKTLAAQLYSEFKAFFPDNAVEYFVSYYDYYQPEAYVPQTDTFIEKDSAINEEIDRLRMAATSALMSRKDVIVIASVSCIYGLGSPDDFRDMVIVIEKGMETPRDKLLERLIENLYDRNDYELTRGNFRVRGEIVDIFPAYMESAIRVEFWGDEVENIYEIDPLTGDTHKALNAFHLYPANQYVTPKHKVVAAEKGIREELEERVAFFEKNNRLIEAQRIRMRTEYDIEPLHEIGFCSDIENYSRHLSGRPAGSRPCTLIDFFPSDFLVFIDESHVTLPQIGGMYFGDRSRIERLVEYGFRLPSALDNRPLRPEEFATVTSQTLFVSATPAAFEFEHSAVIAEQIIRPTGLLDPVMEVRPIKGQVEDLMGEIRKTTADGNRTLVTTLTKRMTEELSDFLQTAGIRVEYLHSDIDAIQRAEILRKLREGEFDVLIGVNLLREGLDLPEVALVGILDGDKEGFLRSETSLIRTAGRAARHDCGRVILYADVLTRSIQKTLAVTQARRDKQIAYNTQHGTTPRSVTRGIQRSLHTYEIKEADPINIAEAGGNEDVAAVLAELEAEMLSAADALEFERAAIIRDQIERLKADRNGTPPPKPAQRKSSRYRKSKK